MKLYFIIYTVLVLIGLVFNTIGECCSNRMNQKNLSNIGCIVTLIAGVVLGLGFCAIDGSVSSGLYSYKVNGITTSSGALSAPFMIIIGIVIGLFSNAISTRISQSIAAWRNKK